MRLAGIARFELANAGVKVRCLYHLAIPLYVRNESALFQKHFSQILS